MQNKLKIIFMGTPDFALPSLRTIDEKYNVCAVFCQPDKVNGRGNKVTYGPIKEYALENDIPVYQPDTFKNNTCKELIEKLDPDIIVVAAYGKMLPTYVLDYPKYGCINIHGSLLPKYRGASPIQYAILNGDAITGITIMKMTEGLDSGDIILQKQIEIEKYETAGELFDRMSELGASCIVSAIEEIVSDRAVYTPQNEAESTHVSMISKEMGRLDFTKSANEIKCFVYGLNPWPCAYIESASGYIKIHRVIFGSDTNAEPGTIVNVGKAGIEVACGDKKSVVITEIQKPGKKKMDAYSFSLGVQIDSGVSIYSL